MDSITTRQLDKLRIKILFQQNVPLQLSGLVVMALYVVLFRQKASLEFLRFWVGATLILMSIRLALARYFHRAYVVCERDFDPVKWEYIFSALTLTSGVIWCIALTAGFPMGDINYDSLLSYILAGITAAAAVAYSSSLKATYCFFLTASVPFAIRLAMQGTLNYYCMSGMMFAYTLIFLKLTYQFNKYAINSISLGFQKDHLIEKIKAMQAEVAHSARMTTVGEMAGGMAHQINNPLAIIQAASEEIGSSLLKDPTQIPKFLEKIHNATLRISTIIKELRIFSGKLEADQGDHYYLAEIFRATLDLCADRFKNHKIDIRIKEYPQDLKVECYGFQISQALYNLLKNSFDALSKQNEKWIEIEVIEIGDNIEIAVTDSGHGIPEEIQKKIMMPFFTTKEGNKGRGLGLSVAKGIIESHGGKLTLDTGWPNTRFVISLPKVRKQNLAKSA